LLPVRSPTDRPLTLAEDDGFNHYLLRCLTHTC
jgi:hypothetical protein